jgi:uncharacterized protein (DUF58 family)
MSATLIWIMCAVIVLSLAVWLVAVAVAARNPAFKEPRSEPRRGRVQGGTHVGGGRSVAPHRDAEIFPDDDPERPTVPVRRRNSPMDL